LKAELHLTGYTFERACNHLEWLLADDRWKACGDFADVNAFVASLQFGEFRAVAVQRERIVKRIKELQPEASNKSIAKLLGVSDMTVGRDLATNVAEENNKAKQTAPPSATSATNVAPPTLTGAEAARAAQKAANRHIRGTFGTSENEWFTPPPYIAAARAVMGEIDLDPATHPIAQQTIQAISHYTVDENGLAQEWRGRVWLNPPYEQPLIAQFVAKLLQELRTRRVEQAILLTHNYTDTAWFHDAEAGADLICFTRGRVKFVDPDGDECAPTQGQAFFYFGPATDRFRETFSAFGFVR
jgi:ParB family chromosome partitioning protein